MAAAAPFSVAAPAPTTFVFGAPAASSISGRPTVITDNTFTVPPTTVTDNTHSSWSHCDTPTTASANHAPVVFALGRHGPPMMQPCVTPSPTTIASGTTRFFDGNIGDPVSTTYQSPVVPTFGRGAFAGHFLNTDFGWNSHILPYQTTTLQDGNTVIHLQSISAIQGHAHRSHEEIRLLDYSMGYRGTALPVPATTRLARGSTPVSEGDSHVGAGTTAPTMSLGSTDVKGSAVEAAPISRKGANGGIFSSSTPSATGNTNSVGGSLIIPYHVTSRQDGNENIHLRSISAMKEYEDQSHEELRFVDYSHGNRGTALSARLNGVEVSSSTVFEGNNSSITAAESLESDGSSRSHVEPISAAATENSPSTTEVKSHAGYEPDFERSTESGCCTGAFKSTVINEEDHLKSVCRLLTTVLPFEVTLRCEGTTSNLFLILVSTKEELFIFDTLTLDAPLVCQELKPLLEHRGILKIIHDSHHTAALLNIFGISEIKRVYDTQLLMEAKSPRWDVEFSQMLDMTTNMSYTRSPYTRGTRNVVDTSVLQKRPLCTNLQRSYLDDARNLHKAFQLQLEHILDKTLWNQMLRASKIRVLYAVRATAVGQRSLCFCSPGEYKVQSYECMQAMDPKKIVKPTPAVVLNDVAPLLELLPEDLASYIRDKADSLFEIVLDKGRAPTAWIGKERVMIGGNNATRIVTEEDINFVTTKLGKFGSDNRAGLEKQLHRISAIRNRSNDIIGLTMRVGRHVSGNAYIITDLLFCHPNSSILFLGEPGSGKTTVIREVARLLAETNNVCIVDTSNEIAGDGDIPHPCVGLARRMMVQNADMQSNVMVECVQNHTPDVMVIDEIGRTSEVEAARTCKNRGVRLIASAHGDLRQLVKNPKLRGLMGGIDRVTVSDEEARKRARYQYGQPLQKTKSERAGPPTFEMIVELKRGAHHEWTIIMNAADAVDKILDGSKYPVQRRTHHPTTGTFHMVHEEA